MERLCSLLLPVSSPCIMLDSEMYLQVPCRHPASSIEAQATSGVPAGCPIGRWPPLGACGTWRISVSANASAFPPGVLMQVPRQGLDVCALGEWHQPCPSPQLRDLYTLSCLVPSHLVPPQVLPQTSAESHLSRLERSPPARRSLYPCRPDRWAGVPLVCTAGVAAESP